MANRMTRWLSTFQSLQNLTLIFADPIPTRCLTEAHQYMVEELYGHVRVKAKVRVIWFGEWNMSTKDCQRFEETIMGMNSLEI